MFKLKPQVKRNVVGNMISYYKTTSPSPAPELISIYVDGGNFNRPYYNFYADKNGTIKLIDLKLDIKKSYKFERVNNVYSHPFYISDLGYKKASTNAITIEGDGNYNYGITGSQSFILTFGNTFSNTDTLTYYCSAHNSMVGTFSLEETSESNIYGTYQYTSKDFKGQDYVSNENIISGEFIVPLVNSNNESKGWVSWQDLAYPTSESKWPVQESVTISFGNNNNATTYHGSALSVATGGFYDEGTPYKFCVSDGKGGNAIITITNVGNGVRNLVFERAK
jgi:hypothetical protein